jgi:iron complex outermembrane receptor protein
MKRENIMKKSRFTQVLEFALLSAVCWPTYAADQPALAMEDLLNMSLEELMQVKVVSEATGSKQPISKAPAIVKVITAEDIKAMGATDLDEILETVPELHVTRRGFLYDPLYLIRGIYTDFNPEVLLLINNIPFQSLQRNDRTSIWAGMPVNAIARIEVLRGSGAAIHADAFAGAINIVTKTQEDIKGTETGGRVGSFNTKDAWVLHGGQYGGFQVATTLEYNDTAGTREIIEEDTQTSLDKLFGTHLSLAPGPLNVGHRSYEARLDIARDAWRWRTGLQEREQVGAGTGFTSVLDPVTRYQRQTLNTDLTYHNPHLTEHWEISGQVSYLYTHRNSDPVERLFLPSAFGGSFPEGQVQEVSFKEDALRFNLSAFYTGFAHHTWLMETSYTNASIFEVRVKRNFDLFTNRPLDQMVDVSDTPAANLPEKSRQSWRLFLQDTWKFASDWEFTSTLRYYRYSDFGETLNPRLGLVWQTRPNLITKLLYGQAFRPPSIVELFAKVPIAETIPR